jgi:hypothetical protein
MSSGFGVSFVNKIIIFVAKSSISLNLVNVTVVKVMSGTYGTYVLFRCCFDLIYDVNDIMIRRVLYVYYVGLYIRV